MGIKVRIENYFNLKDEIEVDSSPNVRLGSWLYDNKSVETIFNLYSAGLFYPSEYANRLGLSARKFIKWMNQFAKFHNLPQVNVRELYNHQWRQKVRRTNLERYGVDNIFKDNSKIKEAMISKYGVDNPMKLSRVKLQRAIKCIDKFGVDHHLKSRDVILKREECNMVKYGFKNAAMHPDIILKGQKTRACKDRRFNRVMELRGIPEDERAHEDFGELLLYCDSSRRDHLKSLGFYNPKFSVEETIIGSLLEKHDIKYVHHVYPKWLNGKELDFLIKINEKYSVAVEVNGVAWHSSNKVAKGNPKDPEYHINKRLACQHHGVKLLGFMDFEINDSTKRQGIIEIILKAIQNPWNDEKLALMRNSSRDQYIVNSFEYDGWIYYDYGKFIKY